MNKVIDVLYVTHGSQVGSQTQFNHVIGGRNGQGKTSILDSIAWALGGNKYKPSKAQREGIMLC